MFQKTPFGHCVGLGLERERIAQGDQKRDYCHCPSKRNENPAHSKGVADIAFLELGLINALEAHPQPITEPPCSTESHPGFALCNCSKPSPVQASPPQILQTAQGTSALALEKNGFLASLHPESLKGCGPVNPIVLHSFLPNGTCSWGWSGPRLLSLS